MLIFFIYMVFTDYHVTQCMNGMLTPRLQTNVLFFFVFFCFLGFFYIFLMTAPSPSQLYARIGFRQEAWGLYLFNVNTSMTHWNANLPPPSFLSRPTKLLSPPPRTLLSKTKQMCFGIYCACNRLYFAHRYTHTQVHSTDWGGLIYRSGTLQIHATTLSVIIYSTFLLIISWMAGYFSA